MKTISFLNNLGKEINTAILDIKTELPKVPDEKVLKPLGEKMFIVNFSDLKDTWSPRELIRRYKGESENLKLLSLKIEDLFERSPDKIIEFLKATVKRGYFIRKSSFNSSVIQEGAEGFRITLKPNEIQRLKEYLQENI